MTNLDLVASLQGVDQCLWEHGVYPTGGVGYRDSGQPYDDLAPEDAAMLAVRAEILRADPGVVHDVELSPVGSPPEVTVLTTGPSAVSLSGLTAGKTASATRARQAVDRATALGVRVTTKVTPALALSQQCSIEHDALSMRRTGGRLVDVWTVVDERTGQLVVTVGADDVALARSALARWGRAVRVVDGPVLTNLLDANRHADRQPWFGGDEVLTPLGRCSDSFRVNGTALLTAQHCGQGSYSNAGQLVGRSFLPLMRAKVDAMLLAGGGAYSNRVWRGGAFDPSPGSMPATGMYPNDRLRYGAPLTISGASGGQATVYVYHPAAGGCAVVDGRQQCQLVMTLSDAGICVHGDSGGPVGVYDPRYGQMLPVGVVSAGGDTSRVHLCAIEDIRAISYLYGGATIG